VRLARRGKAVHGGGVRTNILVFRGLRDHQNPPYKVRDRTGLGRQALKATKKETIKESGLKKEEKDLSQGEKGGGGLETMLPLEVKKR